MNYQALNKNIIVKVESPKEESTISGIIIEKKQQGNIRDFQVVATNELTKELAGKYVLAFIGDINQFTDNGEMYGTLNIDNVLAVRL